jgi:hypothetical protein
MPQRNDILAELQEVSPVLYNAKLTGQKPAVPAGYFEGLGDEVLVMVKETEIISLAGLEKNRPIGIPSQYFDGLADQVMHQIKTHEQEIQQGKIIPLKQNIRIVYLRRLAVAASIAGVLFLGLKLFQDTNIPVNDCEDGIACLTREEIRQYVNDHVGEFETEQIHQAFQPDLETADLENTALPAEETTAPLIEEAQIEKYIEENPATIDFEDALTDIF